MEVWSWTQWTVSTRTGGNLSTAAGWRGANLPHILHPDPPDANPPPPLKRGVNANTSDYHGTQYSIPPRANNVRSGLWRRSVLSAAAMLREQPTLSEADSLPGQHTRGTGTYTTEHSRSAAQLPPEETASSIDPPKPNDNDTTSPPAGAAAVAYTAATPLVTSHAHTLRRASPDSSALSLMVPSTTCTASCGAATATLVTTL